MTAIKTSDFECFIGAIEVEREDVEALYLQRHKNFNRFKLNIIVWVGSKPIRDALLVGRVACYLRYEDCIYFGKGYELHKSITNGLTMGLQLTGRLEP